MKNYEKNHSICCTQGGSKIYGQHSHTILRLEISICGATCHLCFQKLQHLFICTPLYDEQFISCIQIRKTRLQFSPPVSWYGRLTCRQSEHAMCLKHILCIYRDHISSMLFCRLSYWWCWCHCFQAVSKICLCIRTYERCATASIAQLVRAWGC